MSKAPLRKCADPSCREYVRATRCEKHAKEKRGPENRANSHQRGYDKLWSKVRRIKLCDQPLCEDCLSEGRTTAAEHVHHVEKVSERPERRLDVENLMSLCESCHNRRTARGE